MRNDDTIWPFLAVFVGVSLLSTMDVFIKILATYLATGQIVCLRYGFGLLAAFAIFIITRQPRPRPLSFQTAALRSVAMIGAASGFFYALGHLPLAEATAIAFTSPLFTIVLARLLLKEPILFKAIVAIFIGFLGVVIIISGQLKETIGSGELSGYLSVLFASICYALNLILVRRHSLNDSIITMVTLQTAFAFMLAIPFGVWAWQPLQNEQFFFTIIAGILGTSGHLALSWGFSRAAAARLSPIDYTSFLWATLYGWVLFSEQPALSTWIGAILIIFACFIITWKPRPRGITSISN